MGSTGRNTAGVSLVYMEKRVEVVYKGRVQGVGFRFTVERLANQQGVTGFVRNMPDGTVELVVEGEEAALKDFLAGIRSEMERYIHGAAEHWMEAAGEFKGFEIRFY